MSTNLLKHLSDKQQEALFDDLYYLTMPELRGLCECFKVPKTGKKVHLIEVLKQYLLTGAILKERPIPEVSRAPKKGPAVLYQDELILYGSYKNDLRTRLFMKELVGKHFHFTAWGIDWINARWLEGTPPTYKEFADAWQGEYLATREKKRPPKKEWALIRFALAYAEKHPEASRSEIMQLWKEKQAAVVTRVKEVLYALY